MNVFQNTGHGGNSMIYDPRVIGGGLLIIGVAFCTFVGDCGVFKQEPKDHFQYLLCIPTAAGYWLTKDRVMADFIGFVFFLFALGAPFMLGYKHLEKFVTKRSMKRMCEKEKEMENLREEHQYDHPD